MTQIASWPKSYVERFCLSSITYVVNPFPNKPWFLRVCSTSLLKALWEKEKLLVTSNFSFSHSVFYPFWELSAIFVKWKNVVCKLFQFGRVQNLSFGKGLTLYVRTFLKPRMMSNYSWIRQGNYHSKIDTGSRSLLLIVDVICDGLCLFHTVLQGLLFQFCNILLLYAVLQLHFP